MDSTVIYSIYKATNLTNGKCYIGYTENYVRRVKGHKLRSKKNNQSLYCAIRKYGWDSFVWEIIYQSKDGDYTLKIMEPYFIEQYDSYSNGYNMSKGGDGLRDWKPTKLQNDKNSYEIRKLYADANSVYNSKEYKLKHRAAMNTPEYKAKVSGGKNPSAKAVIGPNGNTFETMKMASEYAGCSVNVMRRYCTQHIKGWSFKQ